MKCCENCINNPNNNPFATGVCNCALEGDVVEVTRCEDCIHFDNCAKEIDIVNNGEVHITRIMEWCNHGERREP